MKLSELQELLANYELAKGSPTRMKTYHDSHWMEVGSKHTVEQWDKEEDLANKYIVRVVSFCNTHGIIYDGIL